MSAMRKSIEAAPDLGQVFTGAPVADYMVSLFDLPRQAKVMDPCFGGGVFLDALESKGFLNVTACELDAGLYESNKGRYLRYRLLNKDFLSCSESNAYDGIVMNPPYIRHEKIDDLSGYGITKEKLRRQAIFAGLPKLANLYMYFIVKAIDLLDEGGQLVVVFPGSWMKSKTGRIFEGLMLSTCKVERKIHVRGDVYSRDAFVEAVILKLVKGKSGVSAKEERIESSEGGIKRAQPEENQRIVSFPLPFSQLASIRRGLTTGCNEMYINPDFEAEGNEACFRPIISSPKSIKGYSADNAHLDRLFFPCEKSVTPKAIEYIESWKKKIFREKKPKALCASAGKKNNWYELRETNGEGILFSYFVRNDMKFIMNDRDTAVRDNFYIIKPKIDRWVLFALLNNYFTYCQLEENGKRYGAGLLKIQTYDIENLTFPDCDKFFLRDKQLLIGLGKRLVRFGRRSDIDEITKVLSRYSPTSYGAIARRYELAKAKRLGVG